MNAKNLPRTFVFLLAVAALFYGPVAQLPNYHNFADQNTLFGIAHFIDVATNLGFLSVALLGFFVVLRAKNHLTFRHSYLGYLLFLAGLLLTALGSSFYHLAPNNETLIWDRLPIALLCAGLLAAVYGETHHQNINKITPALAAYAVLSVFWWYGSILFGKDDLRLYLFLQILPLVLIPLWQSIFKRPARERVNFALAMSFYVAAKVTETFDHEIADFFTAQNILMTGHGLKHLLAAIAALLIVWELKMRVAKTA